MIFFFFNDTATTEIYTLSLHDALPIYAAITPAVRRLRALRRIPLAPGESRRVSFTLTGDDLRYVAQDGRRVLEPDRKSTRLNSSHANISYAVFCLKKKKTIYNAVAAAP